MSDRSQPAPDLAFTAFPSNSFLGKTPVSDLEHLQRISIPVTLSAGRALLGPGVSDRSIYILESGLVGRAVLLPDGRRLGLGIEGKGSLIGGDVCPGQPGPAEEAVMLMSGNGWRIPGPAFMERMQAAPALAAILARGYARERAQLQEELACSVRHGITARLARLLAGAFDIAGQSTVTLTQEELAALLRTQRSTVSVAAGKLKAAGAIQYLRGVVKLVSRERLAAISCGCGGHQP